MPTPDDQPFVIVSGLPRSGTSLMMQMLQAGGMPVLTDGLRAADVNNPEGYLEWEPIKRIAQDPQLIQQARGKAVKVISMLLPSLPRSCRYKVIFVLRPIEQIVASQMKMIARRGTIGSALNVGQLTRSLVEHRDQILRQLESLPMEVLRVEYEDLVRQPETVAQRVVQFVGAGRLPNASAMPSVVRPDLHRNR